METRQGDQVSEDTSITACEEASSRSFVNELLYGDQKFGQMTV